MYAVRSFGISATSLNLIHWRPLHQLKVLPIFKDIAALRIVLVCYSQWISKFSDKIKILIMADWFLLNRKSMKALRKLKKEIEIALLHVIEENVPLLDEMDASDTAITVALNRLVAFLSGSLMSTERKYPSVEKEACTILEAVKR